MLSQMAQFRSYLKVEGEEDGVETGCPRRFVGRPVNLEEISQCMQEYERGNDVELWQIRYVKPRLEPGNNFAISHLV